MCESKSLSRVLVSSCLIVAMICGPLVIGSSLWGNEREGLIPNRSDANSIESSNTTGLTIVMDYSHGQDYSGFAAIQDAYLESNLTALGYNVVRATGGINSSVLSGALGLLLGSIRGITKGYIASEVQAVADWFNTNGRFLWVGYDSDFPGSIDEGQFINDNMTMILESVGSHVYGEPTAVQDSVSNLNAAYRVVANNTSDDPFVSDIVMGVDKVLMHAPTLLYGSDSSAPGENINPVALEGSSVENVYPLLYYSQFAQIVDSDITFPFAHSDMETGSFVATTLEVFAGGSGEGAIIVSAASPYADYAPMFTDNYYDVDLDGYKLVLQGIQKGIELIVGSDTTPPDIGMYHEPSHPFPYQDVSVHAEVTDSSGVSDVILEYSVNGTSHTNVTMIKEAGDFYEGVIPAYPADTIIEYRVFASDVVGNWRTTGNMSFVFTWDDYQGPIIEEVYFWPENPTSNQSVLVNATITDSSGVAEAFILWFLEDSTWGEIPLAQDGPIWTAYIPPMPAGTVVAFGVHARDALDNWNVAGNYTYVVAGESEGPTIDVDYWPKTPTEYESVTVVATISDPDGVANAEIIFFLEGEYGGIIQPNHEAGIWSGAIPAQPAGTTVVFLVYAVDSLGHGNSAGNFTYIVIAGDDKEGPAISVTFTPENPNQRQPVLVSAIIDDASGVEEAYILYFLDGGSFGQMSMILSGVIWIGSIPAFPVGTNVSFGVHASDTLGNWNFAGNFTYIVQFESETTTTTAWGNSTGIVYQIVNFIVANISLVGGGAIIVIVIAVVMRARRAQQYASWRSQF